MPSKGSCNFTSDHAEGRGVVPYRGNKRRIHEHGRLNDGVPGISNLFPRTFGIRFFGRSKGPPRRASLGEATAVGGKGLIVSPHRRGAFDDPGREMYLRANP